MSRVTFFKWCISGVVSSAPLFVMLFPLTANAAPTALSCQVNQTDGVSLKTGQTLIENTTAKAIAQGTVIELSVQVAPGVGKVKFVTSRIAASSTLQQHDKMSGGDTPQNGRSCTAKIALVQPKTTTTNQKPPVISK